MKPTAETKAKVSSGLKLWRASMTEGQRAKHLAAMAASRAHGPGSRPKAAELWKDPAYAAKVAESRANSPAWAARGEAISAAQHRRWAKPGAKARSAETHGIRVKVCGIKFLSLKNARAHLISLGHSNSKAHQLVAEARVKQSKLKIKAGPLEVVRP